MHLHKQPMLHLLSKHRLSTEHASLLNPELFLLQQKDHRHFPNGHNCFYAFEIHYRGSVVSLLWKPEDELHSIFLLLIIRSDYILSFLSGHAITELAIKYLSDKKTSREQTGCNQFTHLYTQALPIIIFHSI